MEGHRQNVIESVLSLAIQQAELEHLSEEGSALEESSLVLGVEGQEFSCSLSETGQNELDSPDFSLVFESELSADLYLLIVALLLVCSPWLLGGL